MSSLLTGTYVATHGNEGFDEPGRVTLPTLADMSRRKGFRTAAVSANMQVTPSSGFGRGFERFIGSGAFRGFYLPKASWVTDEAIEILRRLKQERFLLYVHYADPHRRYVPPEKFVRFGWSDEHRYLGEVAFCDSEIGRLLDELDRLDRRRDTLVVFMSDHGEAFGEHGFGGHGNTLHSEETRVPLILRFPGHLPAGRRVKSRVRSIDVFPTMAEVMGLEVPPHVEGESLLPLLADGADTADRPAFSQVGRLGRDRPQRPQISLLSGDYKLILFRDTNRYHLFNVQKDPDEQYDLARDKPALAAAMAADIRRFLESHAHPPPSKAVPGE